MKRILIVDASNLLFRGYHAITAGRKKNGGPINDDGSDNDTGEIPLSVFAISFLQSLKNYVTKFQADEVYAAWDKKLLHPSTNFRKQTATVEYKGNRDPLISKTVFATEEILSPVCASLGVKNMYPRVMEADDVIAWLSHKFTSDKLTVVSVDKDLAQLITPNCTLYDPIKEIEITPDNFEGHLLVPQKCFLYYKALLGDSDNIDGIPGYGKKKAAEAAMDWNPSRFDKDQLILIETYIKLMDLTHGYNVHAEEVVAYQEQLDKHESTTSDFKQFATLVDEHKLTPIKYQMEKWRGVFARGTKIGNTPMNSYLKNLFS